MLTELLGHKPAYITQCISFRKRFRRKNHLLTLCVFAGWHFDTKWRPGTPAGNGRQARLTPNVQIPLNPNEMQSVI